MPEKFREWDVVNYLDSVETLADTWKHAWRKGRETKVCSVSL